MCHNMIRLRGPQEGTPGLVIFCFASLINIIQLTEGDKTCITKQLFNVQLCFIVRLISDTSISKV